MKIGGMDQAMNLYQNYRLRDIPQADQAKQQTGTPAAGIQKQSDGSAAGVQEQTGAPDLQERRNNAGAIEDSRQQPDTRTRSANLENISLSFHPSADGASIGRDSSLMSLDVQKAISDMKKDELLQGYQYFVGSAQELQFPGEDGTVIQKN